MSTVSNTVTDLNIDGKSVKIFLQKNNIDPETLKQIKTMMTHECITSARVMPDCHKGNGCCIGFTFPLIDKIVPNYIGGDIGCGIITYKLGNFNHNKKEKQIDLIIREMVPMGNGHTCVHNKPVATDNDYDLLFSRAQMVADAFSKTYLAKFGVDTTHCKPVYSQEWFKSMCDKVGADYVFVLRELGTLGGGNHYIEINISHTGDKYLTIHSGSRNLGSKICEYHQNKTVDKFNMDAYHTHMNEFRASNPSVTKAQLKDESAKIKQILTDKIHKPYLQGDEAFEYYYDMIFAQMFAQINRRIMCARIVNSLAYGISPYDESNVIESTHNMIDFEDLIVRKGAIRAHKDQLCIVSLNMRDGIVLCKGKGVEDWNQSGPHGLGREIDRGKAKSKLRLKDFEREMKDVYSTSICVETLDESPMAYKDVELVMASFGESLDVVEQLKPIINVKAI
ncbi:putative RtcB-like RNA-splicing ligase [Yasminevirus sp. GU-2018]|uniref:3'-phosphate/5'-hydroxy nucleic acid ligase n=1 Tax=Yasminevirus sp. GU-2018 TaxID=2420051 RepID=A0A5K0U9P5_9VIRU|nr:putative RtcB-like RNA-splicing ligase [Yasminevirus sp. GU-2018]